MLTFTLVLHGFSRAGTIGEPTKFKRADAPPAHATTHPATQISCDSINAVAERDIPKYLARNLEFLRGRRDLNHFGGISTDDIALVEQALRPAIWKGEESLAKAAIACDTKLGLEVGTSLAVAYHFIYTRHWKVDLQMLMSPFEPGRPLQLVEPQPKETYGTIEKLSFAVAS